MERFYWLVEGRLAGCSRPGTAGAALERDLAILREEGIGAVLSLTETPLEDDVCARLRLAVRTQEDNDRLLSALRALAVEAAP